MSTPDDLIGRIRLENLPVLRRTAQAVAYLGRSTDGLSGADVADVVLNDPLMVLKIIGLANTKPRGRFSVEITTIQSAVIMLGIPPLFQQLTDLVTVEESFQDREREREGLLRCMIRAHHAAWQARDLAILHADIKSEEVYIGALLHDMGEMVLWCAAPELALQLRKTIRRQKISKVEAERQVLGFTLWEFQQALAAAWRLPELLLSFMDNEKAGNPRTMMAIICASLARHAEKSWHSPQLLADFSTIAGQYHLALDDVIATAHHNAVVQARHWEAFHVPPAAAWLPMLPGEWPEEDDPDEEVAAETTAPEQAAEICLMPHPEELKRTMDEIAAHMDGTLNLHDMISLVLKGMHEGIGLNRVVFALITPDRNFLKGKFVLGAAEDSPLRTFSVDLRQPNLFARLLAKVQSIWLSDGNRAAVGALLTTEVLETIGGGDFFAMSIFVQNRPVGLFYADRNESGCGLDAHSYEEFKRLCLRAAQGLGHLARPKPSPK